VLIGAVAATPCPDGSCRLNLFADPEAEKVIIALSTLVSPR